MDFQVKPYTQEQKNIVVDFLKHKWKGLSHEERKNRFEWRYLNNPLFKENHIFLAFHEDKIVGFRAFVCQQFSTAEKTIFVFNPSDAIIHSDYRRKGLFSILNKAIIKELKVNKQDQFFILNLSSNYLSTPGYLKLGWKEVDFKLNFMFRLCINYLMKKSVEFHHLNLSYNLKNKLELKLSNQLPVDKLVAFNHNQSHVYRNVKNEKYYNWRYSILDDILYAEVIENEKTLCYAIISKHSKYHYAILEYRFSDLVIFKRMIREVQKKARMPVLRTIGVNQLDQRNFKKCGFIKEPIWLLKLLKLKRMPIIINVIGMNKNNETDLNNWNIQIADIH